MNVERIARAYRWLEYAAFGRALERCRFATLHAAAGARSVLIAGEGDGRFLARLLRVCGAARVDVVDASPRMNALARSRIPAKDVARAHFHCQDVVRDPLPGGGFDVVVTHFFLDCLLPEDAAKVVAMLEGALAPGGIWLISEFRIPASGLRRLHAQAVMATLYWFFRWTSKLQASRLPDWQELLEARGLRLESASDSRFGLLTAQVWRKN